MDRKPPSSILPLEQLPIVAAIAKSVLTAAAAAALVDVRAHASTLETVEMLRDLQYQILHLVYRSLRHQEHHPSRDAATRTLEKLIDNEAVLIKTRAIVRVNIVTAISVYIVASSFAAAL